VSEEHGSLRIVTYPNTILRQRAEDIREIDPALRDHVEKMAGTMYANQGVGLAAPQVGLGKRIIVINPTGEKADEKVLVNPSIVERRGDMEALEGCLSVPGVSGTVRRSSFVRVIAYDLEGNEVEITATDFLARVLQHEIDHLDGMLLIDRMTPESRIAARDALRALEQQGQPSDAGETGS
jgi:peptide deformylase